jgi:hypothetical protein
MAERPRLGLATKVDPNSPEYKAKKFAEEAEQKAKAGAIVDTTLAGVAVGADALVPGAGQVVNAVGKAARPVLTLGASLGLNASDKSKAVNRASADKINAHKDNVDAVNSDLKYQKELLEIEASKRKRDSKNQLKSAKRGNKTAIERFQAQGYTLSDSCEMASGNIIKELNMHGPAAGRTANLPPPTPYDLQLVESFGAPDTNFVPSVLGKGKGISGNDSDTLILDELLKQLGGNNTPVTNKLAMAFECVSPEYQAKILNALAYAGGNVENLPEPLAERGQEKKGNVLTSLLQVVTQGLSDEDKSFIDEGAKMLGNINWK